MSENNKKNGVRKRRSTRVDEAVHIKRPVPGPAPPIAVTKNISEELHPCLRGKDNGREYTVSIAIPGSVMSKQPTLEFKTLLASSIARAAAIYCVDEIIVFDESCSLPALPGTGGNLVDIAVAYEKNPWEPSSLLSLLLQFLECPQYLRKHFFPHQPTLARAGVASPLALPSHVAANENSPYREGVVKSRDDDSWVAVDVGLHNTVPAFSKEAPVGARVTVRMPRRVDGEYRLVPNYTPRQKRGIYWGYNVRLVNGLSGVWHGCPFIEEDEDDSDTDDNDKEEDDDLVEKVKSGYDLVIGTSERGTPVGSYEMPSFRHLLIVFGGPSGLETSLELDESLTANDPSRLFPAYLNTCSDQGSRTIRTEEAILVSLAALNSKIKSNGYSNG